MTFVILLEDYMDNEFIEWIVDNFDMFVYRNINMKKLYAINKFINENDVFKVGATDIDIVEVISLAIKNIKYNRIKNACILNVGGNKRLPKYPIKLSAICKFLNYGNMKFKGYPIFSNAINFIKYNLNDLYMVYVNETY